MNNRRESFIRSLQIFKDIWGKNNNVVSIEERLITPYVGHEREYAIKVVVKPGFTTGMPKLYNGFGVIVEESNYDRQ